MIFLKSTVAILIHLSLSVQSYNIIEGRHLNTSKSLCSSIPTVVIVKYVAIVCVLTESGAQNVHNWRNKRHNDINDAARKWPNAIAYYTIDPSLGRYSIVYSKLQFCKLKVM